MTTKTLKRSKDRKVTNSVTASGNARGANSFGLPSGRDFSCPGQTDFCGRICYAGKLEKVYSGVRNVLMHNWDLLKDADIDTMRDLLSDMISEFVAETDRINARGEVATYDFRIHWDGDFFSREYAMAWADVIRAFGNVRFWAYTRTLDIVDVFDNLPNLALYLSGDPDNMAQVNATADTYSYARIATVADTFKEARATVLDSSRKSYDCPELAKRIPLISSKGSACISCGVCPAARGDVMFSASGK